MLIQYGNLVSLNTIAMVFIIVLIIDLQIAKLSGYSWVWV